MELTDPVEIYVPASNIEAHLIEDLLRSHNIAAVAVDDVSAVGTWWGGSLPMIHHPAIFVDRQHAEAARELLREYETQRQRQRQAVATGAPIEVTCEACGAVSTFAPELNGTTQQCSACLAFVDVGELDWPVDVGEPEDAEPDQDGAGEPQATVMITSS
ncbi:MAG: DUF2007 domain-containing protein [Planctomyces sp.]